MHRLRLIRHTVLLFVVLLTAAGASIGGATRELVEPPSANSAILDPEEARSACQVLVHARGLQAPIRMAMLGDSASFPSIAKHAALLARSMQSPPASRLAPVAPLVAQIRQRSQFFLAQESAVVQTNQAIRSIGKLSPELLLAAEALELEEFVSNAPVAHLAAASQLMMLSQRIGKSAAEFFSLEGVSPEVVFLFSKDVKSFRELVNGMLEGNAELRLRPPRTAKTKERLLSLQRHLAEISKPVEVVLSNLQNFVAAREAQARLLADIKSLDDALQPPCFARE